MARVFIGVGANIDPQANVRRALHRLAALVRITGISTFYRTPPVDRPEQPPFVNGVVAVETEEPPLALKGELRRIEAALGRCRSDDKYAPRPIDLDLLLYDELVIQSGDLTLPDPDIARRAFLAIPLCELAPEFCLPDSGLPLREIAAACAGYPMEPLDDFTASLREEIPHELPES